MRADEGATAEAGRRAKLRQDVEDGEQAKDWGLSSYVGSRSGYDSGVRAGIQHRYGSAGPWTSAAPRATAATFGKTR